MGHADEMDKGLTNRLLRCAPRIVDKTDSYENEANRSDKQLHLQIVPGHPKGLHAHGPRMAAVGKRH